VTEQKATEKIVADEKVVGTKVAESAPTDYRASTDNYVNSDSITMPENGISADQSRAPAGFERRPVPAPKKQSLLTTNEAEQVKVKSQRQIQLESLAEVEQLLKQGLYANAKIKLLELLDSYPDLHSAREQLAVLHLQNNENEAYIELLEQGVLEYPNINSFKILLAKYYAQKQQWLKAIELTDNISTREQDILILRAVANQQLDRHSDAINIYGELLSSDSSRGDWWLGISISLEQLADYSSAAQALKRAKIDSRLNTVQQDYIEAKLKQLQEKL
ncbi:MAG: hypothetical protein V2I33_07815, partial [Kangiellaceae bacterium]|nr:hypothetical protein [Kangiellaceae bacterium]